MTTNKIALRSVEEFMADYMPVYKPIYPLFLGKSELHNAEVGKTDFRRVQSVGDIRGGRILPKDTEIKQVAVMEGKKSFKKYFLANQYTISEMQDRQGIEEVVAQVLDEHQLQADELFLLGEGTSNSTMINNGLFYSNDNNHVTESSASISNGNDKLYDFHQKVIANADDANQIAGRKVVIFYGDEILPLYNGLFETAVKPVKTALAEVLGPEYSMLQMPKACTPSGANGWIIANLDQVKLHYTMLPQLKAQGFNDEKMYFWHNFMMGSMMLEVLAKGGVIRQPASIAS